VQTTLVFRHKLRSSRRFVFENIMDLDHVCTVHKRWFRNLRVVMQKADFVEYQLTSVFYGLKQETTARGGPVDENRYWYEFVTPLAVARVEGLLEGLDGDLVQTERITFDFKWFLTPLFLLLRPLFVRQKKDILQDDAALLERVYELDRAGFQRAELGAPRIVVYGGDGFFGRLLVEDLLKYSPAEIVVASRNPKNVTFAPFQQRVRRAESNLDDYASVLSTIDGARVAISCVGPYQKQSLNLLRACVEKHVPYVDVADDRDFVVRCHQMSSEVAEAEIPAFVGCSVVPGLSSLLTNYIRAEIPSIDRASICITPGTRHPRGPGSFACLLATVGDSFVIPGPNGPRIVQGWTDREEVCFPPPLGHRWVYSVVDVADYFLQPLYFGTKAVDFKIGAELDVLNRALSALRLSGLKGIKWLMPIFRALIYVASPFGTSQGGVMVQVSGRDHLGTKRQALSVFAEERGQLIPALLPSIAAQMILNGEVTGRGLIALPDWLPRERLIRELRKRRLQISASTGEAGAWTACN
jgi:Saccharopine dehydrogenase NADP binding domain